MWHLALETIGLSGSVALHKDSQLVANFPLPSEIGSARSLMPAIESVVRNAAITSSQLELISLAKGPGSFTGLRVSVATAKAIGYALNVPLCAVDTLETLAYRLGLEAISAHQKPALIAAAMDAYRKQVFRLIAVVEPQLAGENAACCGIKLNIILPSHHLDVALWNQNPFHGVDRNLALSAGVLQPSHHDHACDYQVVVGGNAIRRYPLAENSLPPSRICDSRDITAVDVGRYAWQRWLAGERTDPFQLLPNYLRASAAEEKALAPLASTESSES